MKIQVAMINFCGESSVAVCDSNCKKAWGINSRPKNKNGFMYDNELGIAPKDPGTYEGGFAKPESPKEFPNKWCVRECERCSMNEYGEKKLVYNTEKVILRQ